MTENLTFQIGSLKPVSCHWSLSIPLGNIRQQRYREMERIQKETSGMKWVNAQLKDHTQPTFSKLTKETLEQGVKYVQS